MELAKWLMHWTVNLTLRVRCSPRTIHIIHRRTPGKATVTQKSHICMTKLYVLARAHVLHCLRAPPLTYQVNLNNQKGYPRAPDLESKVKNVKIHETS